MLMQNSPLAMVEWSCNLIVTGWNAAAVELFNFFEDEAIGARIDRLLSERQIADLGLDSWQSCEKSGVLREHVGIEGRKLCRWYNTPFVLQDERVGTLATIVDVTHQTALSNEELRSQLQSRTQVLKHTTARLKTAIGMRDRTIRELHSAHAFLFNLIDGMADPICVEDEYRRLILLNEAFCKFVGRSRESLVGKHAQDLFPDVSETTLQQDRRVLLADCSHTTQDSVSDASGRMRFVANTKTRFEDLDDNPYLLSIIRDLTEQATAQKSLKQNENRLKNLAANVPGMIYQFRLSADLEPSFPFVSNSSQTLFGTSPTAIQADANVLIDLIHPDDLDSFDRTVAHSAQTMCDWQWQGRFLSQHGHTVWVQGASRPERLPDNSIVWDGLLINISHTKQAEADLLRSEVELRTQANQLKTALYRLKQTQAKLIQTALLHESKKAIAISSRSAALAFN